MATPITTWSVLFQQGRIDDAIAQWQKALAIQPNDAAAQTSLGNALLQKGLPEQAIVHYSEAQLQLIRGKSIARNNMAWCRPRLPILQFGMERGT